MKVKLTDLSQVHEQITRHLHSLGLEEVEFDDDYYWNIVPEKRYDPYHEPDEFTLGQLSDDLARVRRISIGESEPLGYALVWLSALLRAIGEKHVA